MNKFNSIFGQILHIFSNMEFSSMVKEIKGEKEAKGFNCREQFVGMLFCRLRQAYSLKGDMRRSCKFMGKL
jgi:hypothetical protein